MLDKTNILKQTLIRYLSELSKENIINISEAILSNYLHNKNIVFNQILEKIPIIYLKTRRKKLRLYLNQWKKNITDLSKKKFIFKENTNLKKTLNQTYKKYFSTTPQKIFSKKRLNESYNQKSKMNLMGESCFLFNDFLKRQESFLKQKNESQRQLYKNSEDENDLIYTFIPKINIQKEKNSFKSLPSYLRLYNDSIKRKLKQEIRNEEKIRIENNLKSFYEIETNKNEEKKKIQNEYIYSSELKCFIKNKKERNKGNRIHNSFDIIYNKALNIKKDEFKKKKK